VSYAALMVHVGTERDWNGRVAVATELAVRFDAALIGVAGWLASPAFAINDASASANPEPPGADWRNAEAARLTELGEKFRVAARHVRHVEWRGMLDYPRTLVPGEARAADLVIVGQERVAGDPYFSLNPGIAILRAGRPVLVVPENVGSLAARRVVVAWKDTRESRRALCDALPLLRDAEQVMIVEVCEQGEEAQSESHVNDVAEYLTRHKVIVAAKAFLHTKQSVAGEILRFAKDEGSDLIVTGGYGRSRLGEWIFGGVTRELLADSPVCCLFSH
jgi:nucleotide-binding universal stress UspA family protein